ncbi:hypothetical protein ACK9YZ_10195 [Rhizobium sp. ZK1]|uniref:hypothetical protein n=1 Tax=Rhizobium sp. ZK1 TaxID=3389872 RepID=UPI0039F65D4B
MRIKLAKAQRYACIATAWVIVLFQLLSFAQGGIYGSDWLFSFIVAAVFGLLGTRRITGQQTEESSVPKSTPPEGPANEAAAPETPAPEVDASQDANPTEMDEIKRRILTLNAKVLSMEITWRARNMINLIPKPFETKQDGDEQFVTGADGPQLLEYSRLREKTWLLCFGLVAIRRAGTDLDYVNNLEFLEMWQQTFNSMADEAVFPQAGLGFTIYPEEMVRRFVYDMDAVKHFVIDAAKAAKRGEAGGAKPLLDWIGEQGLEISEPQLIKNALRTLEEWKANSPVSAYPE